MGFGTGLNALLTLVEGAGRADLQPVFERLHAAPWGIPVEIVPGFVLWKVLGNGAEYQAAGLHIEKLPGPPGKREIVRAMRTYSSLPHPFHP